MYKLISALLLLFFANSFLTYLVVFQEAQYLYQENGWMENLQVLLLSSACLVFAWSATRQQALHSTVCWFFSMLCFVFIIREVDFERIDGMPDFVVLMLAEEGRVLFYLILLSLLGLLIRDIRFFVTQWLHYLRLRMVGLIMTAAFFLLVFSHVFDRKIWMIEHRVFYEELAEMSAYYFLLAAAVFSIRELKALCQYFQSTEVEPPISCSRHLSCDNMP